MSSCQLLSASCPDIEHQLEPRTGDETSKMTRSDSASNLARGAVAQRRRALSKSNLKEKEEEEQVLVQSSAQRTGPRGLETLGWAIRFVGVLLGLWTLLVSWSGFSVFMVLLWGLYRSASVPLVFRLDLQSMLCQEERSHCFEDFVH